MRLNCPNCGAEYDIPDGMLSAAGRHVQCSACHTRWFARGEDRPAPSEEQILSRLENWSPRPRPVLVTGRPATTSTLNAPEPALEPEHLGWEFEPELDEPDAAPAPAPGRPVLVTPPPVTPPRESLAKPGDRPSVTQPAAVAGSAPPPRTAPRLDLGETARNPSARADPPRSRFFRGFVIALVFFLIAFGAYRYGTALAVRVPAAAPALDAYAGMIDDLRDELELRLERFRQRDDG
jgi:predicted Zn finger-like uncharacterized protein